MGNLWQGVLGGILPYVNAIMMVINEILKMIAKLFGFKVSEQKVNISADIGADDLADDLGTASGKAKELKNQLMGFDEINNISLETKSSSGTSGTTGTGIDQRLLDAMKEYDNLMDKVSNKATTIRDKILDWLGFTRDLNGDLKWSWKNMNSIAKITSIIVGTIGGIYLIGKITKTITGLKNLINVLKTGKGATTTFGLGLQTLGSGFSNLKTWVSMAVEQYKIFRKNGDSVITSLGKTGSEIYSIIPKWTKLAGGIAGLVASCTLAYNSMKKLSEGTISTQNAILELTGSIIGATTSGAVIGSVFRTSRNCNWCNCRACNIGFYSINWIDNYYNR